MQDKAGHLIAIVDDDESVREATTSLLKSNGFRVETFSSGEEFLKFLDSPLGKKTECLLLDIAMPAMSGLELQDRLAAEARRLPIIFITAHDHEVFRQAVMRAGAVDFLPKPFSEEALLNAIHSALATQTGTRTEK